MREATARLEQAGVETPRLEAEVIFSDLLQQDRSWLYAHSHDMLSVELGERFESLIQRRVQREPVAYIIGRRDFFGLTFEVTPAVLIPRPETELLVEQALQFVGKLASARPEMARPLLVDVGTGSGCIVVALAVHLPQAHFLATDLSAEALAVARRNAQRHAVAGQIQFIQGDLLAGINGPVDLIISNPPYLAQNEIRELAPEILGYEPHLALTDAGNGLTVIERLLTVAAALIRPGGRLLLEMGAAQGRSVMALALARLPDTELSIVPDLAGRDRVLVGRFKG